MDRCGMAYAIIPALNTTDCVDTLISTNSLSSNIIITCGFDIHCVCCGLTRLALCQTAQYNAMRTNFWRGLRWRTHRCTYSFLIKHQIIINSINWYAIHCQCETSNACVIFIIWSVLSVEWKRKYMSSEHSSFHWIRKLLSLPISPTHSMNSQKYAYTHLIYLTTGIRK